MQLPWKPTPGPVLISLGSHSVHFLKLSPEDDDSAVDRGFPFRSPGELFQWWSPSLTQKAPQVLHADKVENYWQGYFILERYSGYMSAKDMEVTMVTLCATWRRPCCDFSASVCHCADTFYLHWQPHLPCHDGFFFFMLIIPSICASNSSWKHLKYQNCVHFFRCKILMLIYIETPSSRSWGITLHSWSVDCPQWFTSREYSMGRRKNE